MSFFKFRENKKRTIVIISVILFFAVIFTAGTIYLNDYYHADMEAIEAFETEAFVKKQEKEDGTIIYAPGDATIGFIFYPGGKVENTAYIPLMEALASEGILCVLPKMPFHLAVFDMNAADGIQENFPQITEWYIGGHSLGGAMASSYLFENYKDYEGIVLLGAYSTKDLSEKDVNVLSVFGSEDKVMNHKKYQENKDNLPTDFLEIIIEGGNHAYFGMYGNQDGDGKATITNEEQINLTAETIAEFMK